MRLLQHRRGQLPPTLSTHRLRLGLPGYLIPFATLAFARQRQNQAREPPSPPVFYVISTHFTATPHIPLSSPDLKLHSIECKSWVKPRISHPTYIAACTPFTPSNSEQRLPPTYYRGCWHVVSRGFLLWYRQTDRLFTWQISSHNTELYNSKAFIAHAASHDQDFSHCRLFRFAASRRSLGRISIPVWPTILSGQLSIAALVSRYLTN